MHELYQKNSAIVVKYLATVGRGESTLKFYEACYQSLFESLERDGLPYSKGYATTWLSQQSEHLGQTAFAAYKAALNKLDDIYQYGEVRHDHFTPEMTRFYKLHECFKEAINGFITSNDTLSPDCLTDYRYNFCDIFYQFQELGCHNISDISYDVLFKFCSMLEARTYHVKSLMHSRLNSLLCYLHSEGRVPYGYTIFVTGIAMRKIHFWDMISPSVVENWKGEQQLSENVFSLEEYIRAGDIVYEKHKNSGYGDGCLSLIIQAVNLFYLFMDVNALEFMPEHAVLWADSLSAYVSASETSSFRRIMIMIGQVLMGIPLDLKSVFSRRKNSLQKLPDWCSAYITEFLEQKKAEKMAPSTIRMINCSCCRFCLFLAQVGITSFSQVTSLHIKQFNLADKHKTPAGKNAYNSRIRKFLMFLADKNILENPFLFLALPKVSAPRETVVVVLSQQEQEELSRLFEDGNDDISLRQKAMLQLGLYMGLRGIDIVNLVIGDINWEDVSIRFIQEKTGYELYLPMPVEVANALYKYIVRERPDSENPKVFLRSKAPYCELETTGACRKALDAALPNRDIPGSGFHVTRKTFATNKLRNGADPDEVKEMLGHRDRANVHKYLSLDESHMKLCCMDLSERSIQMEGRFGQ